VDVRNLTLPAGAFRLKFMDIPATVNPATVHFRSLNDPEKLGVIEQNYEYDLLEPAKLLHKYVGKEVTLVRSTRRADHQARRNQSDFAFRQQRSVWKIGNDIVTGVYAESYRFPEVPANLYERPTLLMSLENSGARKQQIEASYLASNLSWNADYVLTVARDDRTPTFDGWVTVSTTAALLSAMPVSKLVAGELNRVPTESRIRAMDENPRLVGESGGPQFPTGSFQRIPSLFPSAANLRGGQRDQTNQFCCRAVAFPSRKSSWSTAKLLLPQSTESQRAAERSCHGLLQVQK